MATPPTPTPAQILFEACNPINLKRSRRGVICPACGKAKSGGVPLCSDCFSVQEKATVELLKLDLGLGITEGYEQGMLRALLACGAREFHGAME